MIWFAKIIYSLLKSDLVYLSLLIWLNYNMSNLKYLLMIVFLFTLYKDRQYRYRICTLYSSIISCFFIINNSIIQGLVQPNWWFESEQLIKIRIRDLDKKF